MNPAGWEQTPNALLAAVSAGRLSARAFGVFMVLRQRRGLGLSLGSTEVADQLVEGRDAVRAAYRELTAAGHLHIVTVTDARGHRRRVTHLYDIPTPVPGTGNQAPVTQAPEIQAVSTYRPTTTHPPTPQPAPGKPAPGKPSPVRTPPTCPVCQLLHYPAAACDGPPVLVSVPTSKPRRPYRGNRWSPTAGKRRTG
jgi:hypothetical protein